MLADILRASPNPSSSNQYAVITKTPSHFSANTLQQEDKSSSALFSIFCELPANCQTSQTPQLHKRRNTRLLRPSAPSHVEHLDVILADERCQPLAGTLVAAALAQMHQSATTSSQGTWIALGAAMENVPSTNSAPAPSVPKNAPVEVAG